jgi:UDP-N-acetylglucosamine transferase subunit ALG13
VIVAVTGTGSPFDRLINGLAAFARDHQEQVWVQHGASRLVAPLDGAAVVPRPELLERMRQADAVVCHAGCGSIADAFRTGHTPVVVARRQRYGEHVNDHQLELVEVLGAERRVIAVDDVEDLARAIEHARQRKREPPEHDVGHALKQAVAREVDRARSMPPKRRRAATWGMLALATGWLRVDVLGSRRASRDT